MMAAACYLALSLIILGGTLSALVPRVFGRLFAPGAAFAGMLMVFFIPHCIALGLLGTLLALHAGALGHVAGQVGLAIQMACWIALGAHWHRMVRAYPLLDGQLVGDDAQPFGPPKVGAGEVRPVWGTARWWSMVTYRIPAMRRVEVNRNIVYRTVGPLRLGLDVYRVARTPEDRPQPILVYIHGGAWCMGTRQQSRFMLYELAEAGWTVFSISYRLAPRFPLPCAIEDCKAALAWIRAHAAEYGAQPDRIVVMGGSAGGHLAALLAVTPNQPQFQPGFEQADTRVQGAVVLYGVTDLTGAFEDWPDWGMAWLLERVVFRRRYREDPTPFQLASPLTHLHADVPPILLVHGMEDRVVAIEQSRRFAARLRQAGARTVHLLEVPHVPHAFEIFPSPMQRRTVRVIEGFLAQLGQQEAPKDWPAEDAVPPPDENGRCSN
jgi:acetyl esterase/lipase